MCAIVDANVCSQVFGLNRPPAGEKFFDWINTRKGRLVVGGKLSDELSMVRYFEIWAQDALRRGRIIRVNDDSVNTLTEQLKRQGKCESDDEHIIALAEISGARLLYSNDVKLHEDFGNPRLVSRPRGKIYTTNRGKDFSETHRGLLNRAACAAPGRRAA